MFALCILAVTLSIDALVVGFSYTLQQITISWKIRFFIGGITLLFFEATVFVAHLAENIIPSRLVNFCGIILLILMGIYFIVNSLFHTKDQNFDWNNSKDITGREALALAFSLSADSSCAGIAAALSGTTILRLGILFAIMQVIMLSSGTFLAGYFQKIPYINSQKCEILSGVLLIFIAFMRLMT